MRVLLRDVVTGEVRAELQLAAAPRVGEFVHWGRPGDRHHDLVVQVHWVDAEPDAVFAHVEPVREEPLRAKAGAKAGARGRAKRGR